MQQLPNDALLAQVVEHFLEGHRRNVAVLTAQAQALDAAGATPALTEAVIEFAEALEQHMFKEEERLFQMMERGGNTLIVRLIDAMRGDHREHEDRVTTLRALVDQLTVSATNAPAAAQFRTAFPAMLAKLAEHVRAEDEVLFPRVERARGS